MTAATTKTAVVTTPSDTQILITREFAAPRRLVWRAWTEPDLIRRWWSGDKGEVTSVTNDLRVGGAWRWVMRANPGFEVAFHGEYLEIEPDSRLVRTEVFEGAPDASAVSTLTLTGESGRTTVAILVQHSSRDNRDAHLNSGMESGLQSSLALLEQVAMSAAQA
jgi:uncharacterized protein YndB with AHSA1/START domain